MAHCFMTGVQCQIEDAFVLNRREAHNLHQGLKDRIASLQRVLDQLAPLDDDERGMGGPAFARKGFVPRKHRLVCKAVADALAPGFPEIDLFLAWPQYRLQARKLIHHENNTKP